MIAFTNDISDGLGIDYPATITTPLASSMETSNFIMLFLDSVI